MSWLSSGFEQVAQPPGHVGVLAGVVRDLVGGHLVHARLDMLRTLLADQVGDRDDLVVEVAPGQLFEVVRALAGVEQVVGDHAVAGHATQHDAAGAQHEQVVLDVLVDLGDLGVFENRPQRSERFGRVEQRRPRGTAQGEVIGLAGLPAQGDADDLGVEWREARRFEVDGKALLLAEFGEDRGELLGRVDEPIDHRRAGQGRGRSRAGVSTTGAGVFTGVGTGVGTAERGRWHRRGTVLPR